MFYITTSICIISFQTPPKITSLHVLFSPYGCVVCLDRSDSSHGASHAQPRAMSAESSIPNYLAIMKHMFAFAYVWGFGGNLHDRWGFFGIINIFSFISMDFLIIDLFSHIYQYICLSYLFYINSRILFTFYYNTGFIYATNDAHCGMAHA